MTGDELPRIFFEPRALACNQAIRDAFHDRLGQPGIRQSHYFGGRYENIYLGVDQIPALSVVAEIASARAAEILELPVQSLGYGCWFNHMGPGHTTTTHTHDDDDELLSAVYYVQVPPDSGRLEFPGSGLPAHEPRAGELVMFSPTLAHRVSENKSRAFRLSVAFNFGWKPRQQGRAD